MINDAADGDPASTAPADTAQAAGARARRVRLLALLLPVLAASVAFLAWSQVWVAVSLVDGRTVSAAGDAAAPAVPPFALAALALVAALALAGPVFRVVLGLLQSLLGLGIALSGVIAAGDPLAAALAPITAATGIEGLSGVRPLVEAVSTSVWPAVAIAAGAAGFVIGLGIAATASRWPQRTRRYDAVRLVPSTTDARVDRLAAWDALSDGDDPTAR